MHLPHNNHTVRFGSVSERVMEKQLHNNDICKQQEDDHPTKVCKPQTYQNSGLNEAHIPFPQNHALSEVLDTVLAAWTILIYRYQRDTFHQFTWGLKDAAEHDMQCILATGLDILNQSLTESLRQQIGTVRSRSIAVDQESTIFLNDGTEVEVGTG
jgi:hypothetical protein